MTRARKTDFEKAVDALAKHRKASKEKDARLEELASLCPHPSEGRRMSKVHHGYGRYVNVATCGVCGWHCVWNTWRKAYPRFVFDD